MEYQDLNPARKKVSLAGKIIKTFFILSFVWLGLYAVDRVQKEVNGNAGNTGEWQKAPCRILSAGIEVNAKETNPFSIAIRFTYPQAGMEYESTSYHISPKTFSDYTEAWLKIRDLKPGHDAFCLVSPTDPSQAIMEAGATLENVFKVLPVVLMGVGGVLIVLIWLRRNGEMGRRSPGGMTVGLLFGLMGLVMFWYLGVPAIQQRIEVPSWEETPCRILFSQLRESHSGDGPTYREDIFYSYEFRGEAYRSNRLLLGPRISSSGREKKVAFLQKYPEGGGAICYVNPEKPWEAVLLRTSSKLLFSLLFPLPFILAGGIVFVWGLLGWGKQRKERQTIHPLGRAGEPVGSGRRDDPVIPLILSPGRQRKIKAWVSTGIALLWNSITWLGYQMSDMAHWGLIPFVLVGLGIAATAVYFIRAARNPSATVVITDGPLEAGRTFRMDYLVQGQTDNVEFLQIMLCGYEVAVYRRGTDTVTKRGCIHRIPMAEIQDPVHIRQGGANIPLPLEVMPTFQALNNRIEWEVEVRGKILRGPDIRDRFNVVVHPRRIST